MNVLAAIDIHAIAICIDRQIVDGQIIDSCKKQPKVAALENTEVAKGDVAAIFERDGFVPYARLFRPVAWVVATDVAIAPGAEGEPFPVDKAGPTDPGIVDVFTPDERIVPVVVPIILVGVLRCFGLRSVIHATQFAGGPLRKRRCCSEDRRALREVKMNVGLHANGKAKIGAGGKHNRAPTCGDSGIDGRVHTG